LGACRFLRPRLRAFRRLLSRNRSSGRNKWMARLDPHELERPSVDPGSKKIPFERPDEAVRGSRNVRKSGLRGRADQQPNVQRFSPLAKE
jgi:hypothetical protein